MRIVRVRALIPHKGMLLFVQHPHHPADTWALPGGRVEDNEHLDQAITRELFEELGVTPKLGTICYIHQLFLANGDESLELFFLVKNGADFTNIDITATSHGPAEIREAKFINPSEHTVLPEFLVDYFADEQAGKWPIFHVRTANAI